MDRKADTPRPDFLVVPTKEERKDRKRKWTILIFAIVVVLLFLLSPFLALLQN